MCRSGLLALFLVIAAAARSAAQCPGPVVEIDLLNGTVMGNNARVALAVPISAGRTVVTFDMTGCTEAIISVLYTSASSTGWTIDLGDSPTNNGWGGGVFGTTRQNAELQVLNHVVSSYASITGQQIGPAVPLPNSWLRIIVRNGYLFWGSPTTLVPLQGTFAFPDPLGPQSDGNRFYLGINRVIQNLTGAPFPGRVGTGIRRVIINLR